MLLEQNDCISGSDDSSDSENARPNAMEEELRRNSLVELLEKRAIYRAAEHNGGRAHPYQLALIRELRHRTGGVRCHRVECLLSPGKICGLAFHRFIVSAQGNSFANVNAWQRAAIEQAVAASTKLPRSFNLAFDIDQASGYEYWAYRAFCNGNSLAHGIRIQTICLPSQPGRMPSQSLPQNRTPSARCGASKNASMSNNISVVLTQNRVAKRLRSPLRHQKQMAATANVAIRLLKSANLLP